MTAEVRCAGCNRVLEEGDRYIEDTSSGFTNRDADPVVDEILAGVFGGTDGKLLICWDCTEAGGQYDVLVWRGGET